MRTCTHAPSAAHARAIWCLVWLAMLSAIPPRALHAQTVSGTVVHADGTTPVTSAIVLLLNERRDSVRARVVTTSTGRFTLAAPRAETGWLQVLQIGQRPTLDGPIVLAAGETVTRRVTVTEQPIALRAVDVRARNQCTVRPDSGLLVAQLYEEARKALIASAIAADANDITSRYSTFVREEDLTGRVIEPPRVTVATRATSRPFNSLSSDSIARIGYVQTESDGTVYRAPDANVLLSEAFVSAHCFELVNGTGARAAFLGVGFRPMRATRGRVDIRGTMWLDRTTGVLESVEFSYEPIQSDYTRAGVGGVVQFARTTDGPTAGLWFVNRWELRMPRTVRRRDWNMSLHPMPNGLATVLVLDGLSVIGGDVQSLSVGPTLAYTAKTLAIATPTVTALAAAAATTGAPVLCLGRADIDTTGSVQGRVIDKLGFGVTDVQVVASWKVQLRNPGGDLYTWRTQTVSTQSGALGGYTLCGLPLGTPLELSLVRPDDQQRVAEVRLLPDERHVQRDLTVRTIATATFPGADDAKRTRAVEQDDLPPRLRDFDTRARRGNAGEFVTRKDILRRKPGSIIQLLRGVGGISIVDSAGVREARSTRGRVPTRDGLKQCVFPVVVDNTLLNGLEALEAIQPKNLYGIEVYFGPASIPHEFASVSQQWWCGLIALWTID